VVTTANLLGSCFELLWQDDNMPQIFLQTREDNANFQAKKNCLWFSYSECRHKTPHFHSWHRYPPSRNDPPKKSLGPA